MEEGIFPTGYHKHLVNLFEKYAMSIGASDFSVNIRVHLTNLEAYFKIRDINVSSSCTADGDADCWIFSNFTPWNEKLSVIGCELIEDNPGHLTLQSLRRSQPFHREPSSQEVVLEACILFHWLLKHHECIGAVNVYHHESTFKYAFLYYDALSESRGVDSLVVYSCFPDEHHGSQLALACGTMSLLERLELQDMNDDHELGIICTISGTTLIPEAESFWTEFLDNLHDCTNLRYLKLDIEDIGSITHLTTVLRNNRKLEDLYIGKFELWSTELCQLAETLSAEPLLQLQKLELACRFDESELPDFMEALKKHRALTFLKFSVSDVNVESVFGCTQGIVNLQELRLYCGSVDDDRALCLANFMRTGSSLKEVHLEYTKLLQEQIKTLFTALADAPHALPHIYCHIYLGNINFDTSDAWHLPSVHAMRDMGGRVRIYYDGIICSRLSALLKTNDYFFKEITINWSPSSTSEEFEELFVALKSNTTVTQLSVEPDPVTDQLMRDLAELLHVNRTLQSLNLVMGLRASHLKVLFDAVAENRVLSKLALGTCSFDPSARAAFSNMLKMNKALTFLSYFRKEEQDNEQISAALLENHTLRTLQLVPSAAGHIAFKCEEIQRRNQATFNGALRYALKNSTDRNLAVSFERVCHSGNFSSHLAKFAGMSKDEARERIHATKRYITSNYLLITGIIKERLQCARSEPGQVQFDTLHVDCLMEIFSYLKLSDVLI
ncbi:uncharacterized protein LOC135397664 [Ornithodoros turicata]|uniref:uncharacterized protein LOC135397664 n=1 Tax=Ornithodoros turicata TaxID=34597 RepID=UPI003138C86C